MHGVGWHQAKQWAEYAKEDGADGVLLLPPTMYRANAAEVIEHFSRVAEVGLPIMVYNNPIDTKVDLTPDLVAELAQIANIVAVKEFSGDVRRVLEIKELCDIDVIAGADDLLFESLVVGATGWFAGYPNAFPKESVEIYDLVKAGKIDEARDALQAAGRRVPLGLADRVRPGDQALHGHRRPELRRPAPVRRAAPLSAEHEAQVRADTQQRARLPRDPRRRCRTGTSRQPDRAHLRGLFTAVDSHTEGMPTRVVTGGVGVIPGATMNEKRLLLHGAPRRPPARS